MDVKPNKPSADTLLQQILRGSGSEASRPKPHSRYGHRIQGIGYSSQRRELNIFGLLVVITPSQEVCATQPAVP